ncbi:hypothetical protein [Dyadobacter psychrotolerans]|uniref:Uncharacterized protein n=1 Tax=Dyadobacter psychrotolerans TaxID=2541721 RepID=A0A4V2Z2A9_9BACT|nr:hypothetical protein [Dyadobacter psychrotolerans]TDE08148.1 hypothetical protein E0F88_33055 [Dyadobacter psychrotolerans]
MDHLPFTPFFFVLAYITSNLLALLSIFASIRFPKFARVFFIMLFGWACWINSSMALDTPWVYQDYADTAVPLYKQFILGTFEAIVTPMVLVIAICQAFIAIAMLLKGKLFRIGCWGGIVFGLAVAPLGTYAAFPATVFMAIALYLLQKKNDNLFLWERKHDQHKKAYMEHASH